MKQDCFDWRRVLNYLLVGNFFGKFGAENPTSWRTWKSYSFLLENYNCCCCCCWWWWWRGLLVCNG